MLKGHDIVCTGLINWQYDFNKPTMELLTELARHNRVLFIDYAYTVKDIWLHIIGKKSIPLARVMNLTDRLVEYKLSNGSCISVLTPPVVLPINALRPGTLYNSLLRFNTQRILKSIRQAMHRLNFGSPIMINAFHPTIGIGMVGKLDEKALIYHCFDAIEAETWSRLHGEAAEEQLLRQVDAVVTTSQGLFDSRSKIQPNCYLVENGANIDLFGQGNIDRSQRKQKVIGYMGAIDNRLNLDLLETCFRHFANVQFLMVGQIANPEIKKRLSQFENVILAGAYPPHELPQWAARMDVGLIPFTYNIQTKAIYPMKINEYLAAGLPVVCTNFADLRTFGSIVAVCDDKDAFMKAIEKALIENDPALVPPRLALAQANSWENRGRQFAEVLEQVLDLKSAGSQLIQSVS